LKDQPLLSSCRKRKEKHTVGVRNFEINRPMNQEESFIKVIEIGLFTIENAINRLLA